MRATGRRYAAGVDPPLVRIPRELLHVALDDLPGLGVPDAARAALRALLADLPMVPEASLSAQLIGPPAVTLPCLAVLARHVGQGLRDHNLSLAHDRPRLRLERRKLAFLDAAAVAAAHGSGDPRLATEAVLFVVNCTPTLMDLLATRESAGLATFVTATAGFPLLNHWRTVHLDADAPTPWRGPMATRHSRLEKPSLRPLRARWQTDEAVRPRPRIPRPRR